MSSSGQDFAASLRQIADWYDAHPDMEGATEISVNVTKEGRESAARVARALGRAEKNTSGFVFVLSRNFGAVDLRFLYWRDQVCERRVVGTRTVAAQPAMPEREEELIEWDCGSLLSHDEGGEA